MATANLTSIAKRAARLLDLLVNESRLNEYFMYRAPNDGMGNYFVSIDDGEHTEFDPMDPEIEKLLIPPVIQELVDAGYVSGTEVGRNGFQLAILPALHQAVAADFNIEPAAAAFTVDTMHVTVNTAHIHGLANDPDKLADALLERLIPLISQNTAFNSIELQELRESIDALRLTSNDEERRSVIKSILVLIAGIADIYTLYQLLAWLTGLPR